MRWQQDGIQESGWAGTILEQMHLPPEGDGERNMRWLEQREQGCSPQHMKPRAGGKGQESEVRSESFQTVGRGVYHAALASQATP